MKSSERFEFHFKPKSFAQCSPFTCSLPLSLSVSHPQTGPVVIPSTITLCTCLGTKSDQTRREWKRCMKNWKGFTFSVPDTASPFPVLEYLLWGSLYEPATKSLARIFVGPIIRSFVSDTAREKKRCVWQMIVAQNTKQCWGCEVRQKKKRWTVKRVPHRLIWSLVTDDEKDAT